MRAIETEYKADRVSLRIRLQEFQAPTYLNENINKRINDLLSKMKSENFKSIELFEAIAVQEISHVNNIARRNQCHVDKYKLKIDNSKTYAVPKASVLNTVDLISSKVLREQSDLFCSSLGVIRKAGAISVYNGDITKTQVDTIIVPSTSNGLLECIIEQTGLDVNSLKWDPSQQKLSIRFIEANSTKLLCKTILFSNWTPPLTDADNHLQKSTEVFISRAVQYAVTRLKASSITFAVPDVYDKEEILAEAMLSAAKHQIEKCSTLTISFVLLSDQQILFKTFSTKLENMQNVLQFPLPTATLKVYLLGSSDESLRKCREKINSYLTRFMTKEVLTNKDGDSIFKHWNQCMINAFYYYCKERCVLPVHSENNNQTLELSGSKNGIQEVKEKYKVMDELQKQKVQTLKLLPTSLATRRRLSTASNAVTAESVATCYNIMLSHCPKDQSRCQRLADHLMDDGFSVLMTDASTASAQHNKCDCVIICLSEHSQDIEKAIKHTISVSGIKVILVKIQYFSTLVSGWLHQYMIGKLCHYLYGSDDYFNVEYDKLMLKVLKITKPGYISLLQPTTNRTDELQQFNQQIEQQRQHAYDERVQKLRELGKISDDEMKDLIEPALIDQNLVEIKEEEKNETKTKDKKKKRIETTTVSLFPNRRIYIEIQSRFCRMPMVYQRWLRKAPNISKQNIPPFTLTGDINDAVFPIPDDIHKNREYILLCFQKYSRLSIIPCLSRWMYGFWGTSNGPFGKIPIKQLQLADRTFGILSTQMSQSAEDHIPSRKGIFLIQNRASKIHVWENIGFIGAQTKTDEAMKKREQLDNDLTITQEFRETKTKHFMNKYPAKQDQISRLFKKFMEQKRKNAIEFNKYCNTSAS